jgi:hypothetical protein
MNAAPSAGEAGNWLSDARERWNTYGIRTRDIRKGVRRHAKRSGSYIGIGIAVNGLDACHDVLGAADTRNAIESEKRASYFLLSRPARSSDPRGVSKRHGGSRLLPIITRQIGAAPQSVYSCPIGLLLPQ